MKLRRSSWTCEKRLRNKTHATSILRYFRITKKRDTNNEVPATFQDYLNMWSLESITCISLNRRLGILNPNNQDEKAKELIKVNELQSRDVFFQDKILNFSLFVNFSCWATSWRSSLQFGNTTQPAASRSWWKFMMAWQSKTFSKELNLK